jgi:hypothetical protein
MKQGVALVFKSADKISWGTNLSQHGCTLGINLQDAPPCMPMASLSYRVCQEKMFRKSCFQRSQQTLKSFFNLLLQFVAKTFFKMGHTAIHSYDVGKSIA